MHGIRIIKTIVMAVMMFQVVGASSYAGGKVELQLDYSTTLSGGAYPVKIKIKALGDVRALVKTWELYGPGKINPIGSGHEAYYYLPDSSEEKEFATVIFLGTLSGEPKAGKKLKLNIPEIRKKIAALKHLREKEQERKLKAEQKRQKNIEKDKQLKAESDKKRKEEKERRLKAERARQLRAEKEKQRQAEKERKLRAEREEFVKKQNEIERRISRLERSNPSSINSYSDPPGKKTAEKKAVKDWEDKWEGPIDDNKRKISELISRYDYLKNLEKQGKNVGSDLKNIIGKMIRYLDIQEGLYKTFPIENEKKEGMLKRVRLAKRLKSKELFVLNKRKN